MNFRHIALGLGLALPVLASSASDRPPSTLTRYAANAHELVVRALSFVGMNYRRGGDSPEEGFDCSGLVRHVFREALGLSLPRSAREMSTVGEPVSVQELKPGDLVFYNTLRRAFSHVGIYLGDNRFVHAPASGGEVRVEDMRQPYWAKRFNGARRVAPAADAADDRVAGTAPASSGFERRSADYLY
ncbi:MAG: C40 family peptidase [Pseudomonadota bacterium]|jgi:cell wall-associated NlpC family hydrolase